MERDAAAGAAERRQGGRAPESPDPRRRARGGGLACQPGNGRLSQIGALPSPSWRRGRLFTSFFLEKKISLLLLLLSHAKLFISAAVGAADGGG